MVIFAVRAVIRFLGTVIYRGANLTFLMRFDILIVRVFADISISVCEYEYYLFS